MKWKYECESWPGQSLRLLGNLIHSRPRKRVAPPCFCWMYDETSHRLQSVQSLIISCSHWVSWWPVYSLLPCVASLERPRRHGGAKQKRNHQSSMLLSSFLIGLYWTDWMLSMKMVFGQWLNDQSALISTHSHKHTYIRLYICTHIVFESRSISLCKYKCITFQILQYKCW